MTNPQNDPNGNFTDSSGNVAVTIDGKPPVAGQEVKVVNDESGKPVKGHMVSGYIVEDKDENGNSIQIPA